MNLKLNEIQLACKYVVYIIPESSMKQTVLALEQPLYAQLTNNENFHHTKR